MLEFCITSKIIACMMPAGFSSRKKYAHR